MSLRVVPFGAASGFSDQAIAGTHYYSQGFSPTLLGTGTQFSIINKIDSGTVTGMGNIKYYATGPAGAMFAQDDNGNILKEQTPGAFDFAIVRSPGGNGSGLMGDQFGNLLYANGASNNQLGLYDGASWTDNYQSLTPGEHPMDTYEDLRVIANGANVACLFSGGSWNNAAFTLPSGMTITAIKAGPTGILIGANLGYKGAVILWDGNALRAKTPWKWVKGQILSIELSGTEWIVKHQRGAVVTNGYTIKDLFTPFDDPLSFKSYDNLDVLPQQMAVVGDQLVFAMTGHLSSVLSYEFGKMKPGVYLYSLSRHAWNYIPVGTLSTIGIDVKSIFVDVNFNNRILIGYRDRNAAKNYIAQLTSTPPTSAQLVSEVIGVGRIHYQRLFFGPTDKTAEAVVLNMTPLNSMTDPAALTFNVALKIYNFKRPLWGKHFTTASAFSNPIRVDGAGSFGTWTTAQVGDEVTILTGVNAGFVAHITLIQNQGTNSEQWTLDTTPPNNTPANTYLQVQPYTLVKKQTFSNLASFKNIFFSVNSIRGKQFLAKFVFDGLSSPLALEMLTSYFVFNDIGYDQTS